LKQIGASHVIRIRNNPRMEIVEELALTDEDRAAGVTWQAKIKLGDQWQGEPIRVVRVEVDGEALLLQAFTGKCPGKRAMELIRMYLMGYAELDEVIALLGVEKQPSETIREIAADAASGTCRALMAANSILQQGSEGSRRPQANQPAENPRFFAVGAPIMPNSSAFRANLPAGPLEIAAGWQTLFAEAAPRAVEISPAAALPPGKF